MLLVSLISILISDAFAAECHDYLDSPIIPSVLDSNNTCTGSFCYRIEYPINNSVTEQNQIAVLMGCLDYPLVLLKLGCRRNYLGWILCVCDTDFCNMDNSTAVFDLPIVRCRDDPDTGDGNEDKGKQCKSNYCITWRNGQSPDAGELSSAQGYTCQGEWSAPLEMFDIYAHSKGGTIPAGICVSYQITDHYIDEMCSCPYNSDNCTTPSLWPKTSGRPLDDRTSGFIDCATPSDFGGMRKCKGHVCYIMKQKYRDETYGCIRYDERYMDKKFTLGAHKILDKYWYFCDRGMCNANEDPGKIFSGLAGYDDPTPGNQSCKCYIPLGTITYDDEVGELKKEVINLTLILSISIPMGFVIIMLSIVVGYRVYSKKWPRPFPFLLEKTQGRRRIASKPTVIAVVSSKSKKK